MADTPATTRPASQPKQLTLAQAEKDAATANTALLAASERELEDQQKAQKAARAAVRAAQVAARTAEDRAAEATANAEVMQRRLNGTPTPAPVAPVTAPTTPATTPVVAPVVTPTPTAPAVVAPVAPATAREPVIRRSAQATLSMDPFVDPPEPATPAPVADKPEKKPEPAPLSKFDPRGWNWKRYWWLIALCVIAGIIFADVLWSWFAHDWYAIVPGHVSMVLLSILHWVVWPMAGLLGGGWWSTTLNERRAGRQQVTS